MVQTNALAKNETGQVTMPEATRAGIYYTPRVDIFETADEVVLLCDMPGVKPEDLDVRFEKGELNLYGKVQKQQAPAHYLEEEYGVGEFYRAFSIATQIDAEKISAEYHDGVLTVHLPKQERVKPKRIAVKAG